MRWLICDLNSAKDAASAWHSVNLTAHSLICKKKQQEALDASRTSPAFEESENKEALVASRTSPGLEYETEVIDLESVCFVLAYAASVYPAVQVSEGRWVVEMSKPGHWLTVLDMKQLFHVPTQ